MLKTIEFFENMGKAKIKEKASKRVVCKLSGVHKGEQDILTLMTPPEYADGDPNVRLGCLKNFAISTRFLHSTALITGFLEIISHFNKTC